MSIFLIFYELLIFFIDKLILTIYILAMNKTQEPNAVYKETFEIFEKLNSTNKNAVCMAIQGIYLSQKNTEAACGKAQKDN